MGPKQAARSLASKSFQHPQEPHDTPNSPILQNSAMSPFWRRRTQPAPQPDTEKELKDQDPAEEEKKQVRCPNALPCSRPCCPLRLPLPLANVVWAFLYDRSGAQPRKRRAPGCCAAHPPAPVAAQVRLLLGPSEALPMPSLTVINPLVLQRRRNSRRMTPTIPTPGTLRQWRA